MLENEQHVLKILAQAKTERSLQELSEALGIEESALASLLASMEAKGRVAGKLQETLRAELTREGEKYCREGTPEKRLALAAKGAKLLFDKAAEKASLSDAEKGIALKWGKQLGLITLKPSAKGLELEVLKAEEKEFARDAFLKTASRAPEEAAAQKIAADIERAGLVKLIPKRQAFAKITHKGAEALKHEKIEVSQLTPEMLKSGKWRESLPALKPYDLRTVIAPLSPGRKHAYKELLDKVKDQLVGLGFREVHGSLAETEFWNADALFMPQDHPARDIHDVFQLEQPRQGELPKALAERVKRAHEKGGATGSKGWQYSWSAQLAARLVLRSHTTPVSARNLAAGLQPPARLFTIGKVFRPDQIDWSHFIEFNQLEGIVMDEDMSLAELLGYLKRFAVDVFGAKGVKFVPSYFPFTEPSVEMYADMPGRGWIEVGGSGLFRPEMLEALQVDVPVLAWGLGVDRLAAMTLGIKDIRSLHGTDIAFLRK